MNNSLFYKNIKFIIISSSIILSIKYNYYKKIIKDTNQKRIFSATEVYKRVNINPIEFYSNGEMSEYKYGPEDFQSIVVIRYDDKLYAYQNNSPYFHPFIFKNYIIIHILVWMINNWKLNVRLGMLELYFDNLLKFGWAVQMQFNCSSKQMHTRNQTHQS